MASIGDLDGLNPTIRPERVEKIKNDMRKYYSEEQV